MSYLLDTCAVSELRKEVPRSVHSWFEKRDVSLFYIAAVTIAELWDGIERLPVSKKRRDLEEWFHGELYNRFAGNILAIDDRVAKEWGALNAKLLKVGISVGVQDLYVAATAKSFGLELVTLNIKDFQAIDIPMVNPWE